MTRKQELVVVDIIAVISEFFLLSLGFGLGVFTPLANTEMTGVGFLKLITNIGMACLLTALIIFALNAPAEKTMRIVLYVLAILSLIPVHFFKTDKRTFWTWAVYAANFLLLIAMICLRAKTNLHFFAFFISSLSYLGVITFAMLLGHWYLVVPKLSESPLKKALICIWITLGIKLILTFLAIEKSWDFFREGTTLGGGFSFNWLILLMRIIWGYAIIAVLSYFTWKLVRIRSIQSATGILYVMVFFVFIGEIISHYLFFNFNLII